MVRWNTFGDKPCIRSLALVQLLLTRLKEESCYRFKCWITWKCGNRITPDEHSKNNFLLAEGKLFWQTIRTEGLWTCDTVCLKSSCSLAASQTWCEHVWELRLWTPRGLRWPLRCTVRRVKLCFRIPGIPPGGFRRGDFYLYSSSSDLDQLGLRWNGMKDPAACRKGPKQSDACQVEKAWVSKKIISE